MSKHNRERRRLRALAKAGRPHAPPGSRRALIAERYPEPPRYRDDNGPVPAQPACYSQEPAPVRRKLEGVRARLQAGLRFPHVYRGRG